MKMEDKMEDAKEFLEKHSDPASLLKWLRNAAEEKSIKENNPYWWRISQIFEAAAIEASKVDKKNPYKKG